MPGIRERARERLNHLGNRVFAPTRGGFGYFTNSGPRTARKVALTFDDGPSKPSTVEVLDALDEHGVPGTFFCVGAHAQRFPDLLVRMVERGHVVANHTIAHRRFSTFNLLDDGHIDAATKAIVAAIGREPLLFRPPWGWLTPWEARRARQRGYTIVGWDVHTLDWVVPEIDGAQIADAVCRDVQPGSIVLLHDARSLLFDCVKPQTAHAVRRIVPELKARGYELVTVPELLGVPAYSS
jgi:peptidoglycan/xylan/chitin deacetylase (PgdA/CDA1 family)